MRQNIPCETIKRTQHGEIRCGPSTREGAAPYRFREVPQASLVSTQLSLALKGISQGWQVGLDSKRILSLTNYHF